MKKYTIEILHKIAEQRKGKCLDNEYKNYSHKIRWQCEKGHIWKAPTRDIAAGRSWCKKCSVINRSFSIEVAHQEAKKNQGICLSKKYKNSNVPLKWKCKNNHIFYSRLSSVRSGTWCIECCRDSLKINTFKKCKKVAQKIGIKCLSTRYEGVNSPMKWQCGTCTHIWETTYQAIAVAGRTGNKACPACYVIKNKKGHNIELCHKYAQQRDGQCLTKTYKDQYTKMKWECKEGHQWKTQFKQIKIGRWCPHCAELKRKCKGQSITRNFFEKFFKVQFKSVFPSWLINPETKRKMEIDGFNKELGIGFEYQGFQHYKFVKFIHGTRKKFIQQQQRDKIKVQTFKEKGLKLIIIKEFNTNWTLARIESYLKDELQRQLNQPD